MKITVSNMSVPQEAFEEHEIDCPICGPFTTTVFGEMWRPTSCECEAACAACDLSTECNDDCEYYEWSLKAAMAAERKEE